MSYARLRVEKSPNGIAEVVLNRPNKLNIMDFQFFEEVGKAFNELDSDSNVKVIILWAEGKIFTAGLDLKSAIADITSAQKDSDSTAVKSTVFFKRVTELQKSFLAINKCKKPVIAAIHSTCIGGGVDLICWCDIRLASQDANFSIKETQIAIVADLGTLQRIGKLTSKGFAREMAFTGEAVSAERALKFGFINEIYANKDELLKGARAMATKIADNSPLVVQGTKISLEYADEHSTLDGLNQIALWNTSFLMSEDLTEAVASFIEKRKAIFRNKL